MGEPQGEDFMVTGGRMLGKNPGKCAVHDHKERPLSGGKVPAPPPPPPPQVGEVLCLPGGGSPGGGRIFNVVWFPGVFSMDQLYIIFSAENSGVQLGSYVVSGQPLHYWRPVAINMV